LSKARSKICEHRRRKQWHRAFDKLSPNGRRWRAKKTRSNATRGFDTSARTDFCWRTTKNRVALHLHPEFVRRDDHMQDEHTFFPGQQWAKAGIHAGHGAARGSRRSPG
jgi:hypothetical protein